jgi:hypothetical protein
MKYLKGRVDYASIELNVKKKTNGPLGYHFVGIWWGVENLFAWDL